MAGRVLSPLLLLGRPLVSLPASESHVKEADRVGWGRVGVIKSASAVIEGRRPVRGGTQIHDDVSGDAGRQDLTTVRAPGRVTGLEAAARTAPVPVPGGRARTGRAPGAVHS